MDDMNTSLHFEDAGNDGPDVDTLITGLVREYLFRKGYYEALQAYDEEVGARNNKYSDTVSLVQSLRLVQLFQENFKKDMPFASVLEVLTSYYYHKVPGENKPKASPSVPVKSSVPEVAPTLPPVGMKATPFNTPVTLDPSKSEPEKPKASDGGGFWARLAASQNKTEPTPPPTVSTSTATPNAPVPTPAAAASTGMSFWERLQASKKDAAPATAEPKKFAYTAPDGKGFSDRNEYRKYLFENFYSYSRRTNETLIKAPGQIDGQPFTLEDLKDCTVILADWSETVQADRIENCRILIGASCGSVFLRNCKNCTITVACKQLRTRDCEDSTIYLYAKTDPIIEASWRLTFAPYNVSYPLLDTHFAKANLDPLQNHWRNIFDFSKDDTQLPTPHWKYMDFDTDYAPWVLDSLPGFEAPKYKPINPVPIDSGENVATETLEGMMTFDIRTTDQQAAQEVLEKEEERILQTLEEDEDESSAPEEDGTMVDKKITAILGRQGVNTPPKLAPTPAPPIVARRN